MWRMRPSATTALPESVSTSPSRRTGQITCETKLTNTNNSPTVMPPRAMNALPTISTSPICERQNKSLKPQ